MWISAGILLLGHVMLTMLEVLEKPEGDPDGLPWHVGRIQEPGTLDQGPVVFNGPRCDSLSTGVGHPFRPDVEVDVTEGRRTEKGGPIIMMFCDPSERNPKLRSISD
ncbi:hypothetical protein QBC45DRAFT_488239 [Copromyces sp. CBS 386.78]|nr:hypothetical protein QBC45DRAFT_488239 [Copromyces sp. CBS 386.78]